MQIIIITKMYVIAARKYCGSDHVHRYARIDCGFLSNKTKKMTVIPTYLLFLTQIPSLAINYLSYLQILVYVFSASGESLGAQKIRCVFFFFSYNFHFILLIIHNIPFTLGCCFHRMVLGFTSCSSSSSLGMQIGL